MLSDKTTVVFDKSYYVIFFFKVPIVIKAIEASLPVGVKVHIRAHEEFDEENRYIPDKELNTLKEELENLGGPVKKK